MPGQNSGPTRDLAGTSCKTEQEALRSFVARYCQVAPERVALSCKRLEGGLESVAVTRAHARIVAPEDSSQRWQSRHSLAFVAKHLEGDLSREAAVYERVVQPRAPWAAPALLGVDHVAPRIDSRPGQPSCRLYLEWVRPVRCWPWKQSLHIQRVLELLARVHALPPRTDFDVPAGHAGHTALASWDYEAELAAAARVALRVLEQARHPDFARARRSLPALRRAVAALPAMRRHLLGAAPLGTAILHGDVHSGNVLLRTEGGQKQPLLIDWARARVGSPLEDVSSWLQSLGYWEPQARRRHDTLLAGYLAARGLRPRLDRALRDAYWLASASNILAGALVYYLNMAVHARTPRERHAAIHALEDGLRIVRRADVCWRRMDARRQPTPLTGPRDERNRRRPPACPSRPASGSRSDWHWQAGNSSTGQD